MLFRFGSLLIVDIPMSWENSNSNSKTLILKDSSGRSIWTYLTASPCLINTNINTTIPQTNIISTIKQLINAVSQFLQMCRNIRIKFLSWAYMYTTLNYFLGKRVIHTNPSKFEERSFSDIHVCADYVWKKEEKYMILYFEAGSSRGTLQRRIC